MALTDEMSNWINGLTADGHETLRMPIRTVAEDLGLHMDTYTDEDVFLSILAVISDRIEHEYFPIPEFEDGKIVRWGEKVVNSKTGEVVRVAEISYTLAGLVTVYGAARRDKLSFPEGHKLTRYVELDTQEKIDADALKTYCFYWNGNETNCNECAAVSNIQAILNTQKGVNAILCAKAQRLDLLRRQRELDGVE
jgi:hypothetical protein